MKLGIDIGSSYATIASLNNDGQPVLLKDVASKKDHEVFTPLKVQIEDQFAFVGQTINALLKSKFNLNFGYDFFHVIGKKDWIFIDNNGRKWSPENLLALVIKKLKLDAESSGPELVTGVVATFPSYFNDNQKELFSKAFIKNDLKLDYLLEDYKAVLEGYGFSKEEKEDKNFLIVDIGQTHLNVNIVRNGNNIRTPLYKSSRHEIGGRNFDLKVMDLILSQLSRVEGLNFDERLKDDRDLLKTAELIKAKLSSKFSSIITEVISINNVLVEIVLTKNTFEREIAPLIDELMEIVKRAIDEADLKGEKIDHVLLVGGASKMVFIQEKLKEFFGQENNKVICESPRKVMAKGAALYAYTKGQDSSYELSESSKVVKLGHDINILLQDELTDQKIDTAFFTKESVIPDTKSIPIDLSGTNRKKIQFKVIKNKSLGDLSEVLGIIDVVGGLDIAISTIELSVNIDNAGDCNFKLKNKETGEILDFKYISGISPAPKKIKVLRRKIRVIPKSKKTKVVLKTKKNLKPKNTSNKIKIKVKPKNKMVFPSNISTKTNSKKNIEPKIDWKIIINEMVINNLK